MKAALTCATTNTNGLGGEGMTPVCERFHFLRAAAQLTLRQPSLSDGVPELTAAC